jgi:hypothetical protein
MIAVPETEKHISFLCPQVVSLFGCQQCIVQPLFKIGLAECSPLASFLIFFHARAVWERH